MEFDFNKINKFLNDEEIKINKTIRSSKNNNVDSQINTTITPLNTKVDFNKIKQEQNSILSTPYQPTTKIVKQSEKSIETDYQKLFDNSSNKFNNAVLEEANKNTIQLANSGSKGIDIGNIFKTPENFKDGYQFGDVTKTTLSTIGDVAASGVEGILRFGEGLGDLAQYGVAGVADLFGADNFANSVRKNAQQDAISQLYDMTGIDKLNDNSVAGSTTNAIAQGVGNVVAMSNAGALLPKGMQTIGTKNFKLPTASIVSGMGSGMTEAYNNGATDGEAFVYGLGSGLVEGFSESLFSGLGSKFSKIYGGGALDDVAIKSLTNKIGNKTLKILSESGLKALGEGTEEVISGYGNAIIKKLTYLSDEDFKKIVEDENLLEQFIIGTLTSAVMQSPSTITSVKNGTDYIPDEISQNSSKTTANLNKNTQNSINTLIHDNNVENSVKYSYLPTNNEKSNNLRQSASNYFNNSQETINMINTIDKVVQDKGYNVLFDNTIVNSRGESVNAQIKALDNGEIEIKINPNSERAGEFLLCHEITHAIETNSMKELVMDYASKHSDFNESLESLKQSYGTNEVTDEVLADISGQLFGNQEFINNLSMKQPNVFKRIYNKIVELANKITGNSKEDLFIKNLKNKWETAYRNTSLEESINNLNDSTKYSTIGLKGAKNLSKNSDSRYYKNMLKNYHNAVDIFNSSNENLETTNIKSKQETGWFQTKYGDWSALISDENSKMLQKLEPNKTYKLGDILEHELLYEAYPELQKLKIKTADIETTGGYASFQFLPANTITDEIYIRNSDLNKKDFRKTLLHEINHYIQHKENYDKRSRGTNSKIAGVEDYRNNLGEIISNETKINADLTQEELDAIILPEQAKENPQYKNIREKLLESNRNDLLKNGDDNNALQNLELPIQNKIQNNKVVNKKDNNSGRIINDNEEFYEENSNENIEQTNEITDKSHQEDTNGIEELENSSFSYDNQGRKLTKEQQEYFKDSKAKDENGNLKVLYHGTPNEFNKFSYEFLGTNGTLLGKGFYLTDDTKVAEAYANKGENGKVMELYADIKKPLKWGETTISKQQFQKFVEAVNQATEGRLFADYSGEFSEKGSQQYNSTLNDILMDYEYGGDDIDLVSGILNSTGMSWDKGYGILKDTTGYDGIIVTTDVYDSGEGNVYIPFQSNQIKNIDNTNPTSDADIRYSQQNDKWQEYVEKNYKSTGTKTDMKKHLYPLETAQTENKTVEKLPTAKRDIPQNPTKESTYNTTEEIRELTTKQQRHKKVQEYRQQAKEDIGNMSDWVDTSLMKQKTNTMKRNLRDIMPKEQADSLYEKYFQNISKNNATIENEINKYNSKIQKLNLNDKESTAVQMLGEYKYNPDTNITGLQVTDYISNNKLDYNKISKSVEVFRETYDELFDRVNQAYREQGYDEIPYRKGYFPHFIEEHGKTMLGKLAEKLGWKFNDENLPTSIAGLTEFFTPGKKWTSFSQHRKGKITDYNALKGFDNYIRGIMDTIYHIEDIQKLRALENEIRYQHSEKGVQEQIDKISENDELTLEQQEKLIEEVYDNYKIPLPNFVTNLRDFTNNLAGKKSALDRSMEQGVGRKAYNVMYNVSNRVSANMVGLNISSALTNFIPITQAWSQVKTKNLVKAVKQTMSSTFTDDHFADSSTFLTNRTKKADRLYKTGLEKASDKAGVLFEAIDSFTSNVIVRSKYLENIENGMSKTQAIENADEFAKDVIAGRSKGELPTIFNSKNPVVKLVTAFQLEVNNQYGYMFKDLPKDLKDEGMAKLVGAFLKMFLGAWLYNKAKESITGTKSAFSPIDMIEETIETVGNEDLSTYEKISTTAKKYAQDLPFVGGLLGGGRLPINSAIPDVAVVTESITNLSSEDTDKKQSALKNLTNELKKPLFYVVMPFGGGQLKKTIEGASMYSGKLPTAGSYTNSGNLRFTADKTPTGVAKALTFGQYSSKEAQDYIDSGFKTISKNHIQEMKNLGMTSTEYRKYRTGLAKAGTTNSEKLNYINNLDVSIEQKNIMANNVVDSDKYTVDMSNYNDYGSYETMKYALQNPTNYSIITSITNYDDYLSYKEEVNNIKEKYSGTENSTVRKQKVFQYVNSLPYSKTQKIILFNMLGNYGISNYKNDVHSYINGLDISKSEKEQMWQQIYGK